MPQTFQLKNVKHLTSEDKKLLSSSSNPIDHLMLGLANSNVPTLGHMLEALGVSGKQASDYINSMCRAGANPGVIAAIGAGLGYLYAKQETARAKQDLLEADDD